MVKQVLVVTGSVRPNSVNSKIVPIVAEAARTRGADVMMADLGQLNLPFYDDVETPSSPAFQPLHPQVRRWTDMVAAADGVVLVTPEYNHTMSPVQLNAIDWIYKEWQGKPVALIGYGWRSGAAQAHAAAREALAVNLKAEVLDTQTNLYFGKDLNPDGSVLDAGVVETGIGATLDALMARLG